MVKCFQTYTLVFTQKECSSLSALTRKAAFIFQQQISNIELFFQHADGSETPIESDNDLLSLKYLVRKPEIAFTIRVSKSKEQIEQELISSEVDGYLSQTYDEVSEEIAEKEIND